MDQYPGGKCHADPEIDSTNFPNPQGEQSILPWLFAGGIILQFDLFAFFEAFVEYHGVGMTDTIEMRVRDRNVVSRRFGFLKKQTVLLMQSKGSNC